MSVEDRTSHVLRTWVRHKARQLRDPHEGTSLAAIVKGTVTESFRLAKWRILGLPAPGALLTSDRFELLARAIETVTGPGLWLEFGVWRGESITYIARTSGHPIVGFDSFQGLPTDWVPGARAGAFSTEGVLPQVDARVTLVKGWFDETLPTFLTAHPGEPVAFLHVDSDLYSSARVVLTALGGRIREGTVVVFDEFCGTLPDDEARAWREFCRAQHLAFRWLGACLTGSVALRVVSGGP